MLYIRKDGHYRRVERRAFFERWERLGYSIVDEDAPQPAAEVDEPTEDDLIVVGGGYYELPNGERVRGKEAALKALAELEGEV